MNAQDCSYRALPESAFASDEVIAEHSRLRRRKAYSGTRLSNALPMRSAFGRKDDVESAKKEEIVIVFLPAAVIASIAPRGIGLG